MLSRVSLLAVLAVAACTAPPPPAQAQQPPCCNVVVIEREVVRVPAKPKPKPTTVVKREVLTVVPAADCCIEDIRVKYVDCVLRDGKYWWLYQATDGRRFKMPEPRRKETDLLRRLRDGRTIWFSES